MTDTRWEKRARQFASSGTTWDCLRALDSLHCPEDVVLQLLEHDDSIVRSHAWCHPNLPRWFIDEAMQHYLKTSDPAAREVFNEKYTCPHYLYNLTRNPNMTSKDLSEFPDDYILSHPNCPQRILRKAAKGKGNRGLINRRTVTYNKGIGEDIQLTLINPDASNVRDREYLAKNPAVTSRVIEAWIPEESEVSVLGMLIQHANATPELKAAILTRLYAIAAGRGKPLTHAARRIIARYATDEAEVLRALKVEDGSLRRVPSSLLKEAVANPVVSLPVVLAACESPSRYTRRAAARHPECPLEGQVIVALRD